MSSHPRRKARVDNNQAQIVKELRDIPGMSVITGMDDLAVGFKGITLLCECKNPNCYSKVTGELLESKKKPRQIELDKTYTGARIYAQCSEDVLRWFGVIK